MFMMPLRLADPGETNIIKRVSGTPEVKKHLEDLGFVAGGEVSIISMTAGNIIVNVKESRIAISEEMANKIYV
jgi:ferrous iron transport protein A